MSGGRGVGASFWFRQLYWILVFVIEMRGDKTKREIGIKNMLALTSIWKGYMNLTYGSDLRRKLCFI